jgi:hypothetical protein
VKKLIIVVVVAAAAATGCAKTAVVDLKLVEPCDEKNQALNGVSSFVISSNGGPEPTTVSFSKDEGAKPLEIGLGSITVTAQAFADDVSQAGSSGSLPKAIGRTPPLLITEATGDFHTMVLTGLVDGFGKTTSEDGSCQNMTQSAPLKGRHGHTATFVPKLNKVLIWGGAVFNAAGEEEFLASAELYDPATGTFEDVPMDPNNGGGARAYHQATALPDGRVLITGGFGVISGKHQALTSAVLFDPDLGVDLPYRAFQLSTARANHTSTLMEGAGVIVITGGCTGTAEDDACSPTQAGAGLHGPSTNNPLDPTKPLIAEIFDVTQPTQAADTVPVPETSGPELGRAFHTATALGTDAAAVLVVAGGANADGPVNTFEIFRAQGGTLQRNPRPPSLAPFPDGKTPVRHAAVAIDSSRMLVIGGQTQAAAGTPGGPGTKDVFLFSTTSGIDTNALSMFGGAGRVGALATLFSDGTVLIVGGTQTPGPDGLPPPTAEVLRPGAGTGILADEILKGPPLGQTRDHAAMAVMPGNQVLYVGGHTTVPPLTSVDSVEIYFGN